MTEYNASLSKAFDRGLKPRKKQLRFYFAEHYGVTLAA